MRSTDSQRTTLFDMIEHGHELPSLCLEPGNGRAAQ